MDKYSDIKLEIVGELQKNESYVRKLESALNVPKSTVSDKLKELTNENIVDFTEEGRNKIFFLKNSFEAKNILKIYELYKLNKLLGKYPKLKIVIENLLAETESELIILFGSYAKFNSLDASDIDIYIETKNKTLISKLKLINSRLNIKIGNFDKSSPLGIEIMKNHVIIQNVDRYYKIIEE